MDLLNHVIILTTAKRAWLLAFCNTPKVELAAIADDLYEQIEEIKEILTVPDFDTALLIC